MRNLHGRIPGPVWGAVVGMALCATAGAALADDIAVDCDDPAQTINGALQLLSDPVGPHSISVSGTCHEAVNVFNRDRLTIEGNGATIVSDSTASPALNIGGSHAISVTGLTLTGGSVGLRVARAAEVVASDLTIHGNAGAGVSVDSSYLRLDGAMTIESNGGSGLNSGSSRIFLFDVAGANVIRDNGGGGISLGDGSRGNLIGATTIKGNAGFGILVFHTSFMFLVAAVIDGNGDTGVNIQETSHGELGACTISNNGASTSNGGLRVADNSDLYIDGGVVVTGNTGVGVQAELAGELSSLGGNTVSANSGDGVRVRRLSLGHFFAPDVISGNGAHGLSCDDSSLVVGDLTGVRKVKCPNIDKEIAPAPAAARHARGE